MPDATGIARFSVAVPSIVWITKSVAGYDSRSSAIHSPHHVTACAPTRSDSAPPSARH